MFKKKVEGFLHQHGTQLKNQGIVVGVSGGPDSLALLHFLWSNRDIWNLSIVAAHVDHMFRGKESADEAKFVKQFCRERNIPVEIKQINVPAYIAATKQNPQVAARECRYQFFKEIMQAYKYSFLALGHHGDDQVETILMRLTRGSTGKARAGILFKRAFSKGEIIRPFLCINREEIEDYCLKHQLKPRRDPSNEKEIYSRNRIRKNILPYLKKENPRIHEHFQRFSEELQEDEDLLQELTIQKMNKVIKKDKDKMTVCIKNLMTMPMSLQRRGIQLILNYLYQDKPSTLSAIHIDDFFSLITSSNPSGRLDFPEGLQIIRSYDEVFFLSSRYVNSPFYYEVNGEATISLPNGDEISIEDVKDINQVTPHHLDQILLDKGQIAFPLIIRTRKKGDRMSLKGMTGTKKIKDIFIDQKVSIHLRDEWPIITDCNDNILWLPGIKKANFFREDNSKASYLLLKYKSNDSSRGQLVMKKDIEKILITEEELQDKIKEIASQLTEDYQDKFPLAVGVLKGAMPFMGDLLKRIDTFLEMDFMDVSSYGNSTVSSGEVKILKDLDTSVEGRNILIIEDIIDSGLTLSYLVELFRYRKAKSIKIVTLLDKPSGRKADIAADYVGFVVPDKFVVGYGLDYAEKYRNLPYIGVLKPEVYANNN